MCVIGRKRICLRAAKRGMLEPLLLIIDIQGQSVVILCLPLEHRRMKVISLRKETRVHKKQEQQLASFFPVDNGADPRYRRSKGAARASLPAGHHL